jgi:MFS family permease
MPTTSTDTDVSPRALHVRAAIRPPLAEPENSAYDRVFWLTYLANGLATVANAMLVRYADFVNLVGGEERQLGLIVGFGMLGSIAMRLVQGIAMDRYGAGRIWRWSVAIFACSLFAHLGISTAYGPGVFMVRAIMQTSLAGVFGSSLTFVSLRVSPPRVAEMIGALGTSGFIGIMVGPLISDWICGGSQIGASQVQGLFVTAGMMATLAWLATSLATAGHARPTYRRRAGVWKVLGRYAPFSVAVMAAAMGAGIAIPMTFLRPFAMQLNIGSIGVFFAVYASTAFVTRVVTRQQFERHGNRPWILVGMVLLAASFLLYLPVQKTWHLAVPGVTAGMAHALLFPAVMSAGTTVFPRRFRGVATSFMLAMFDFGTFLGAPVVGAFIQHSKQLTAAAYPAMFAGTSALLIVVTAGYFLSSSRDEPRPSV